MVDGERTSGSGRVPDDIERWFNDGQILAERYGLQRVAAPWRVVEVIANLGEPDEPWLVKGEWREFKTHDAAVRLRDEWAVQGKTVLLQTGITFWLDADEVPGSGRGSTDERQALAP